MTSPKDATAYVRSLPVKDQTAITFGPAFPRRNMSEIRSYFMSHNRYVDRRQFLQLMGMTAMASTLPATIARALEIPANNATGTIQDVENIVILMQENRPFDHHFGTLRGVRGFNDPRAVNINLPLQGGGTTLVPVFLQPAGAANEAAGFAVPPDSGTLGGPANGVPVIPPFRVNPES